MKQTKICNACNLIKDADCFRKSKRNKDGLENSCKNCKKLIYERDKIKIIARVKKYSDAHREHLDAKRKIRYNEHHDEIREKARLNRLSDPAIKQYEHEYKNNIRKFCFEKLGGKCVICGVSDINVMCIDHINDDGKFERASGASLVKIRNKILRGEELERYQQLCYNCNLKKFIHSKVNFMVGKTKKCPTCHRDLDCGMFKGDKKYQDGIYYECKECTRKRDLILKQICFMKLGRLSCVCGVNDLEVLSVDHINNDGRFKRLEDGTSTELYRRIVDGSIDRNRFQTLCMNCNIKKSHGMPVLVGERFDYYNDLDQILSSTELFDFNGVNFKQISTYDSVKFLEQNHYLGYGRADVVSYGAFFNNELIAVVKFSPIVRANVAKSVGHDQRSTFELDRICVLQNRNINGFKSYLLKEVPKIVKIDYPNIECLISFLDIKQFNETTYDNTEWINDGAGSRRFKYVDDNGVEYCDKTIQGLAKSIKLSTTQYSNLHNLRRSYTVWNTKFVYNLNKIIPDEHNVVNNLFACRYCGKKFNEQVKAGHYIKCPNYKRPDIPKCVCNFESKTMAEMKVHRKTCTLWQSRDKEFLRKIRLCETILKNTGVAVSNPFKLKEVQDKIKKTNLERYGAANVLSKNSQLYNKIFRSNERDILMKKQAEVDRMKRVYNERVAGSIAERQSRCRCLVDFDFKDINVKTIVNADQFLDSYHYAGVGRNAKLIYGAYLDNELIAVAKYGHVCRQEVATSMGLNSTQVLELDRFCIHSDYHKKNFASWFLTRTRELVYINCLNITHLISFADTMYAHVGSIYKASGWKKVNETKCSYVYLIKDPNGEIIKINKKTMYEKAKKLGLKEHEYRNKMGYVKCVTKPKIKFVYQLR